MDAERTVSSECAVFGQWPRHSNELVGKLRGGLDLPAIDGTVDAYLDIRTLRCPVRLWLGSRLAYISRDEWVISRTVDYPAPEWLGCE